MNFSNAAMIQVLYTSVFNNMPELLKVLQVISECDALILKKIPSILALKKN